ncbi:MAG: InlB B-repeat-containing protein [Clostridia bacterium]|nr:InlB B-repeat-containing protein [Clostridia bacterium]
MFRKKQSIIKTLGLVALGSFALSLATYTPNIAQAAETLSLSEKSFLMRGANLELASGNLRFSAVLEKGEAEKKFGANFDLLEEAGVLVLPTKNVSGTITLETSGVEKTVTKKSDWLLVWDVKGAEGKEFYQFSALIDDAKSGEELTEYTAVGYVTTADGTIYTEPVTRSVAQVARATYDNKSFVYSSKVLPYIPDCEVSFVVADGDSMDAINVRYGDEIPEMDVPTKEGWEFDGWYMNGEPFSGAGKKVLDNVEVRAGYSKALETKKTKIDVRYDNTFDFSGVADKLSKIMIGDTVVDSSLYALNDGVLTLKKEGLSALGLTNGQRYDLQFYVGDYEYYKTSLQASERTLIFNAADFESVLEADLAGDYALANDLDFTGLQPTPVGSNSAQFTGTLDGQGFTLKNYTAHADTSVFTGELELGWRSVIHSIGKGGVVKNLGIEYTNAYWRSIAPFARNNGTIDNVCVKATYTRNDMSTVVQNTANAGIVAINAGTIKNCIANVHFSDLKMKLAGAITHENYAGAKVENCYAVTNVALNPVHTDKGFSEGNEVYAHVNALLNGLSGRLTKENGWSNAWDFKNVSETGLVIKSLNFGKSISCGQIAYLSAGIEGKLESVIESDMSGEYVLTSNLNFDGITTAPIGNANNHFVGKLDGNGYTIKNYVGGVSTDNADGNVCARSFIAIIGAGGVVTNLGLEYTNGNEKRMAPFGYNYGTIENVYVKTNLPGTAQTNDASNVSGGMVSVNYTGGIIKNCIVDVIYGATNTLADSNSGAAVGRNIHGTIMNCYAVCNLSLTITKTNEGSAKATNVGVYTSIADLVAAQSASVTAENGWSEYWKVADGAIAFGRVIN